VQLFQKPLVLQLYSLMADYTDSFELSPSKEDLRRTSERITLVNVPCHTPIAAVPERGDVLINLCYSLPLTQNETKDIQGQLVGFRQVKYVARIPYVTARESCVERERVELRFHPRTRPSLK
jgi:hypothetical protein